jgi:hypothetical protein
MRVRDNWTLVGFDIGYLTTTTIRELRLSNSECDMPRTPLNLLTTKNKQEQDEPVNFLTELSKGLNLNHYWEVCTIDTGDWELRFRKSWSLA